MNGVHHTVNSVHRQANPRAANQDANDPRLGADQGAAVDSGPEDGAGGTEHDALVVGASCSGRAGCRVGPQRGTGRHPLPADQEDVTRLPYELGWCLGRSAPAMSTPPPSKT